MRERRGETIYALYRGDQFLAEGTLEELSEQTGLKISSLGYLNSPSYRKRLKPGSRAKYLIVAERGYLKADELDLETLRMLVKESGMCRQEIAREILIQPHEWNTILSGNRALSRPDAEIVADLLEVDMADFLTEKGRENFL